MKDLVKARLGRALPALAAACAGLVFAAAAASAQTPFYRVAPQALDGPPGSIIRREPMLQAPAYVVAWRVLYRSRGLKRRADRRLRHRHRAEVARRRRAAGRSSPGRIRRPG